MLLSDGPGERDVSTWRRGVGKVTIVVADLVDVEVGSRPPFRKISRIGENFFRWDDVIEPRPDRVMWAMRSI